MTAKSIFDRAAVGLLPVLPTRLMHHLMFLLQSNPHIPDGWGYHVRPIHYYEPLPDFREITESRLKRRREFPGLDFRWQEQLALVRALAKDFSDELEQLSQSNGNQPFDFQNPYFSGFDAAVYYALVRRLKPARIIEIGGGFSTSIAAGALARNKEEGRPGSLTCIEPFPEERLTAAGLEFNLIEKPVQEVDLDYFSSLDANDILFIDSSHTVKFDSDVCRELLEILPALKEGVWIQVHDIFFPHDYPAEWLIEQRLALNEQYLLEAFLAFNQQFSIGLSNHWLSIDHAQAASKLWPSSIGAASSIWLRKQNDQGRDG